jgi:DNA replication protein DnaC
VAAACTVCGDTGFEQIEKDGREFVRPCVCRRPQSSARTVDAFMAATRVPARYEHCDFLSFEGDGVLISAKERAMTFAGEYPHSGFDHGLGLLFTGDSGVGKTHLAVAVLRELWIGKGARGQFWDFHELIREIRNCYNEETRTTELQILDPVIEADVLVLDDLGAWKMTEWMLDTLFFILNGRYMAKRATIITTNFPDAPPDVARKAGDRRREYLVDRIGVPLRSRLMEMCIVVPMTGMDFRQIRQEGRQPRGWKGSVLPPDDPPPIRPKFGG